MRPPLRCIGTISAITVSYGIFSPENTSPQQHSCPHKFNWTGWLKKIVNFLKYGYNISCAKRKILFHKIFHFKIMINLKGAFYTNEPNESIKTSSVKICLGPL